MNNADWFTGSGGFTAPDILLTIQLIGVALLLTYMAWLCKQAYSNFCDEEITATDMIIVWLRSAGATLVIMYLIIE